MYSKSIATLSALALAGLPVVAGAHPSHPVPSTSHKCVPHGVGYRVSGSLASASLTVTGGRASGTIAIVVSGANKPARDGGVVKGGTQTYTLTGVRVSHASTVAQPNPAVGTHTVVKGKITVVAPKCTDKSGAGQVTIDHVVFLPASKGRH